MKTMIAAGVFPSVSPLPLDPGGFSQESRDFRALQAAIQAGNLPNARGAFNTFQLDLQRASLTAGGSNPFNQSGPLGLDLQQVGGAIDAGNPVNLRKAFATLSQDLKGVFQSSGNQPASPAHSQPRKYGAGNTAGRTSAFKSFSDSANRHAGSLLNLRG
jgi:hypothetical protein